MVAIPVPAERIFDHDDRPKRQIAGCLQSLESSLRGLLDDILRVNIEDRGAFCPTSTGICPNVRVDQVLGVDGKSNGLN